MARGDGKTTEITLAVVTFDRPGQLSHALESLEREAARCGGAEILVVDDGSQAAEEVAAAVAAAPSARLVRRRHGGVAAARNTAAREAAGTYLCFTDDDCIPTPGWSSALVQALRSGAEVAAGPTLSVTGGSRVVVASQLVTNWLVDTDAAERASTRFAPGSNFACRRELLLRLPLDESYGPVGGEDRDWCARLALAGIRIAYEQRASVLHEPSLTTRSFWEKYVRYGRAALILRRSHDRRRLRASPHARLLRAGFRTGPGVGLLVALAQVATAVGALRQLAAGSAQPR